MPYTASLTVHQAMAARVLRAPTSWFERTPIGRVLNRFSSDIETLVRAWRACLPARPPACDALVLSSHSL